MKKTNRLKLVGAIVAEMERQGLSAYALGKLAKMPAATITRILSGDRPDPQASTVERLAGALGAEFVLTHLPDKRGKAK